MFYQERKRNIVHLIPGESTMKHLHTFNNFPVFIGCTDKPKEEDLFADMTFDICEKTGLIQLRNLISPEILYKDYHSEAVGSLWNEHHDKFSDLVCKQINKKNMKILEIGGSNGKLANLILSKTNKNPEYTIIEPCAQNNSNPNIQIINEFFSENVNLDGKYDLIIHSHVLEHFHNPVSSLKTMRELLSEKGKIIFSVPDMFRGLYSGNPSTLNFEHTIYLSHNLICQICHFLKLSVMKVVEFNNHSLFFSLRKNNQLKVVEISQTKDKHSEKAFEAFKNSSSEFIEKVNQRLEYETNPNIFLFGGHIFNQSLIVNGLKTEKINCIIDNSDLKENKRLYGTNLFVKKPEIIENLQNPIVILRAGMYSEEILNQLKKINKNVEII